MTASIQKSSTLNFRKQKNKIVIRHSDIEDMNPSIPDEGEVVYATDTNELYIGDGLTKVEELSPISGGGSGSTNYNELTNKPQINGTTLSGNKTSEDLGLASAAEGALAASAIQPGDDISDLNNDAGYITGIDSGDVTTALGYTPADSSSLAAVATTGDYDDLLNKPTIPVAQVNSDWNADSGVAQILNKPTIPDTSNMVTTNTTQTITGEKIFTGKLNYCAGMTYILAGNGGTKLGYWSYDIDGQQNITLQTMTASTRNINFKTNNGGKVTYNGSEIAKKSDIVAQVQADWDQADVDAVDYIKNKPYIPAGVVIDQTYDPTSTNGQSGTAVAEAVSTKVTANTAITGATKCKITYDSKGLVTAGDDLAESDIPSLTLSKISDVTASASEVNVLDGITASTSELNVLDGITASTTELNYVDGVTSSIQTQLNDKVSSVSSANKVYATDNNSSNITISYTTANTASTIVQRDSNSQVNVNLTPSDNTHAASKKYVDDKFDTAITEAVVFQGIVADQTLLPSSGNTNGDLYWITEFVSPAPAGMTVGDSGAAIWNAKLATPQWQYTEDAIYQPDDATIELNANAKLSVKLSNSANNSLTTDANGLIVDISGKLDKNNAITGATKCKITYDSKGLVTAGADLAASDIPSLNLSKISDVSATAAEVNYLSGVTSSVQTQISGKVSSSSTADQVYATDNSGVNTTISYTTANTASTVVMRDSNSQINVASTPTATTHATSKTYVDTGLAGKISQYAVMPTATEADYNSGRVIQYVGASDMDYTANWFYKCDRMDLGDESYYYYWYNVNVQSSPSSSQLVPYQSSGNAGKPLVTNGTSASWNDTISYPLKLVNTSSTATQLTIGRGSTTSRYMYFKPSSTAAQMNIGFGSTDYYILTSSVFRPNTNAGASLGNSSYKWSSLFVNYAYISGLYDSSYNYHSLLSMPMYYDNVNDYIPTTMYNYDGKLIQFTGADSSYYDDTTGNTVPLKQGYFYKGVYDAMYDFTNWEQIDVQPAIKPVTTMPAASSALVGKVYQYMGVTNATYTHGYIYECQDNMGPEWVRIDVQPGGGGGSSTLAGLSDVSLSTPTDGQILTYDDMSGVWYNGNAPKEVMFATYGTTTYTTIKSWIDNGYYVVCKHGDYYGGLARVASSAIYFQYIIADTMYSVYVNTSNSWNYINYNYATDSNIKPIVMDFSVDSSTGAITCTFNQNPTNKSVHTVIGNTSIAGTWSGSGTSWVFTPTTADDILDNANGFVVTVS